MDINVLKEAQEKIVQFIKELSNSIELESFHLDMEPPRTFWGFRARREVEEVLTKIMKKMGLVGDDIYSVWVLCTTVGIVIFVPCYRKLYSINEIVARLKELKDYATKERVVQKIQEELERLK
jgi:hypothetical protein